MDRIGTVREYVDDAMLRVTKLSARRHAYVHLYGVAQACAMIAMKRGVDPELAVAAGMLHDIATYATLDPREHAARGAVMAREILTGLAVFSDGEIDAICTAIANHSSKAAVHGALDEALKDADVW